MADEKKPTSPGQAAGNPARPSGPGATPNRDKPRTAPVVEGRPGDVQEVKPAGPGTAGSTNPAGSANKPGPVSPGGTSGPSSSSTGPSSPASSGSSKGSSANLASGSGKSASDTKAAAGSAASKASPASSAPKPASTPSKPPPASSSGSGNQSGGGFGKTIAGGAIGALVALACVWVYQSFSGAPGNSEVAAVGKRVATIEAGLSDQRKAVTALNAAQDKVLAPIRKQIAAFEQNLKQQTDSSAALIAKLRSDVEGLAKQNTSAASLAPVTTRIAELEKRMDAAKSTARAKSDPAATAGQSPPPGTAAAVPDANALVARAEKALAPELAKLTTRLAALEGKVKPPVDINPLQNQISALEKKLDPIGKQLVPMEGALDRNGKLAATNAKAIAETGKKLTASIEKSNAAAMAIVARTLFERVSSGQPFSEILGAAAALGADEKQLSVLKPLAEKGVRSRAILVRGFAALEEKLLEPKTPSADAPLMDRLKQGAMRLVKVRPVGKTEGSSLGAVVSQIKSALRGGQLKAARELFNKLPKDMQSLAKSYIAGLDARINAEQASAGLLSAALAQLRSGKT